MVFLEELRKHWQELLIRIDERQETCMKDIGEMKEKLFGNGEEGLTVKMKKAEDRLSVLEMHRLELKKTLMWFGGFVIAGVGIIVAILNYFKI